MAKGPKTIFARVRPCGSLRYRTASHGCETRFAQTVLAKSVDRVRRLSRTQSGEPQGEDVQQRITGFHQDEHGDWVANLTCGHGQHVRHNPPWSNRPWVVTEKGREGHLGEILFCKKCVEENIGE